MKKKKVLRQNKRVAAEEMPRYGFTAVKQEADHVAGHWILCVNDHMSVATLLVSLGRRRERGSYRP